MTSIQALIRRSSRAQHRIEGILPQMIQALKKPFGPNQTLVLSPDGSLHLVEDASEFPGVHLTIFVNGGNPMPRLGDPKSYEWVCDLVTQMIEKSPWELVNCESDKPLSRTVPTFEEVVETWCGDGAGGLNVDGVACKIRMAIGR